MAEASAAQKYEAKRRLAAGAAKRLLEHFPAYAPHRRPRTSEEMVAYVEWALPRARKLGTRVSKAEARAIGWVHGFYRLQREEDAAALAAQRAAALAEHAALGQEIEAERAVQGS